MKHVSFLVLILLYLIVASAYAFVTPAWQAPDEPAHYNYVRQLAAGDFPIITEGDYDQQDQATTISNRFPPDDGVLEWEYEDYQPPLYYLALTPAYWLADGAVVGLRLVSVLMGAGVVALAYASTLLLFPRRRWVALTVAAFVAFLPQHLAILGSINNDALAELLVAGMIYLLLRWQQSAESGTKYPLYLAILLGLAFLTKVTAYLMAGVIGFYLLYRFWGRWVDFFRMAFGIFLPAGLIGLLWWGRNLLVYGGLDFLATGAHNEVVVGQPTTAEWVDANGLGTVLGLFGRTTFDSFWGQFGWMSSPLPDWMYGPLFLFTCLVVIGGIWRIRRRRPFSAERKQQTIILVGLLGLNLLLYVTYNFLFVQHQGRYLFVSLIPIGVAVAIGAEAWFLLLFKRNSRWLYLLPFGLCVGLLGVSFFTLTRILPCLAHNAC